MKPQMFETHKIGEPKKMFFMPETTESGLITNGSGLVDDKGNIIKNAEKSFNSHYESNLEKVKNYNSSLRQIEDERIKKIEHPNGFIIRMFVIEPKETTILIDDSKYIVNIHSGAGRPDGDPVKCPLQYSDVGVINVVPTGENIFKVGDIVQVYNTFYEDPRRYVAVNGVPQLDDISFYRPYPKNKNEGTPTDITDIDFGYVRLKHHEIICKVGNIYDI